jgi:hypothetical protein
VADPEVRGEGAQALGGGELADGGLLLEGQLPRAGAISGGCKCLTPPRPPRCGWWCCPEIGETNAARVRGTAGRRGCDPRRFRPNVMPLGTSAESAARNGNRFGRGVISTAVQLSTTTRLTIWRPTLLRSPGVATCHKLRMGRSPPSEGTPTAALVASMRAECFVERLATEGLLLGGVRRHHPAGMIGVPGDHCPDSSTGHGRRRYRRHAAQRNARASRQPPP